MCSLNFFLFSFFKSSFCFTKQMFADVLWINNTLSPFKKKTTGVRQPPSNQEKRLLFGYLSRLPKWLLFPVFDIRLSALVDNKTIFIHVQ